MQAPVELTFCATAFWKNGWLFAPIPHTRTFKSIVARGADPWADMDETQTSRMRETVNCNPSYLLQHNNRGYEGTLKQNCSDTPYRDAPPTLRFAELRIRNELDAFPREDLAGG